MSGMSIHMHKPSPGAFHMLRGFIPILVQTIDNINRLIAAAGSVKNGMKRIL